ncbi:hypothetical protein JMJ35_005098 [Cladonia borealis]|uniref:WD repeat protein n=1 Tax=Cladonia borealis TaxID=184061 RepID=A0AA39R1C2_9LECA|nr:hypothetical protein JMJ35_005098 [Cladonia borealis]
MARKARQRISYVLPLANSPGGHRLGVNGLAVDSDRSILYSGGRDGLICAWDLDLDLTRSSFNDNDGLSSPEDPSKSRTKATTFRQQVQAHTHWVNDILLTHSNSALVSASSDITVKVWRPHSEENQIPTTVGLHSDYVKCLASPGTHADWVASGGLDHKIRLWDLNGGGEKLHIDVGEDESSAKGSVYALSVRGSIMASGGPESIVRLWDPKSGKRITNFVGHTDNIRDILINEDGDTVMTASSDQSIKVWSITAGRCMYTLTMHNDSVWSLYSDHPQLSLFYSSDRSGLVAKTDVRDCVDMDEGLSIAIAQEHEGVSKVVVAGDYFWTATSSSSINRWHDVNTRNEVQSPESLRQQQRSSIASRSKVPSPPPNSKVPSPPPSSPPATNSTARLTIPLSCVLRISNNATFPGQRPRDIEVSTIYSQASARKMSEAVIDQDIIIPFHDLPRETIEGQNGLIKHVMLNDRRRVLTLDTAGEVMMWDLLKCVPIQSFGKRHLEDVMPEVNTVESVANWCGVDTRTGRLACILEENYCFDAETYADELELENPSDFRDDQRINLGKWILRFLFARLIDEEYARDAKFRHDLVASTSKPTSLQRDNAPSSIQLPVITTEDSQVLMNADDTLITPRPTNGIIKPAMTPGLTIGTATPALNGATNSNRPPTAEDSTALEKRISQLSQTRNSMDRSSDYFTSNNQPKGASDAQPKTPGPPGEPSSDTGTQSPVDGEKEEKSKEGGSLFGKGFRMKFPKKLGRTSTDVKPAVVDEKSEESDKSEEKDDRTIQDSFYGCIQKIRYEYEERMQNDPSRHLSSGITPSPLSETPILRPPPFTTVIIQDERPDSGGVADLYTGTVSSVGHDADLIEKVAPTWLGDLLLKNQMPPKEIPKVSFVLLPFQDLLPSIASPDGNSRLNANRMLRAKKILAYVAERIETLPEQPDPYALKPEDYLELYCQNQLVAHNTTLATLRAHIWKTGGDVVLYYKSNGRRPELEEEYAKKLAKHATEEPSAKTGPVMPI